MEVALDKEKLDRNITFYRAGWFLFSILVLGPAWFVASSVEGLSFGVAADGVPLLLRDSLFFPEWLGYLLRYPITLVATFIPGSSAVVFLFLMSIFSYGALAVTFIYFGFVQPPNYNAMKTKLDPDWEAKENKNVIQKPVFRAVTFSGFIVFLFLTTLLGEVIFGYNRDPIADDYVGKVFLIDKKGKKTPINVTVKLTLVDPGRIYDRKPGYSGRSLRIEFDGEQEHLKGLPIFGIDPKLLTINSKSIWYGYSVCPIHKGWTEKDRFGNYIDKYLLRSYDYKFTRPDDADMVRCPETVHFGMANFDEGELAIPNLAQGYTIAAVLERKSHISFIQRMIMKHRYNKDKNTFYGKD